VDAALLFTVRFEDRLCVVVFFVFPVVFFD